jgi:protein-disulfide isomerase
MKLLTPGLLLIACLLAGWPALLQAENSGPIASHPQSTPTEEENCGTDDDVLAVLNGTEIRRADVQPMIASPRSELETILARVRQRQLELAINQILLDQEAKRTGIPSEKLLSEKVLTRVIPPTDQEALAFFQQNRQQFQSDFNSARQQITSHLLRQRQSLKAGEYATELRRKASIQTLARTNDLSNFEAASSLLLARVNDKHVLLADVDKELTIIIGELKEEAYLLQMEAIEKITSAMLLRDEAVRRGLAAENTAALLKADNEASAQEQAATLIAELRQNADFQLFIQPPTAPVCEIAVDAQPMLGNPEAPVTLAIFHDYECARCGLLHESLGQLLKEYDSKIRCVFFEFPLTRHPNAIPAAIAAKAAHLQGRYLEYTTLLFQNRANLQPSTLRELAARAGLDQTAFDDSVAGQIALGEVLNDRQQGLKLGVFSTPTVFVNGRRLNDKGYQSLKAAVEQALSASASRP